MISECRPLRVSRVREGERQTIGFNRYIVVPDAGSRELLAAQLWKPSDRLRARQHEPGRQLMVHSNAAIAIESDESIEGKAQSHCCSAS